MKTPKNRFFLLFSGIFLLFFAPIHAQKDTKETKPAEDRCTKELILGVPKVSEKNLFLLTSTSEKIKGIKYIDFCEKDKLLLLKYDLEMYPRPDDVIKAFQSQNIVMPMLVKVGTHESVKEMCVKQFTK